VGEVINFMAYKQFREDMENEELREEVLDFFFSATEGAPDSFSFDLSLEDDE
tara:strand:+ start:1963 stop:2118 length:156 start_codon:yes stop_codon:yes gene_type:complete